MRRFSANYVLPVTCPPIKNGIVEVDNNGEIISIVDPGREFQEIHSTEFHNGVIVPGFVNAHCHLELSHLKGQVKSGSGIAGFIKAVTEYRINDSEVIEKAIQLAIREIELTGTVAVGDICNTLDTFFLKSRSSIFFHNFIEVFGINPLAAERIIENANGIMRGFEKLQNSSTSITPHSTYSLSNTLWKTVREHINKSNLPVSIHYAESLPEFEYLMNGTGPLMERYRLLNIPFDVPFERTPFKVITDNINHNKDVLFIHNTFASVEELVELNRIYRKATFVTCPESNLIIEGKLPDLVSMYKHGLRIAIGTDSLASATSLSMLHHIKLLLDNFTDIPFSEILKWSTLNGAEALNVSGRFGSIEIGKAPGLNLITNFDFDKMCPRANSEVRRLI
ncbi:MAG TPA: amidohydrolase family protein [Tenuifilaceae bacterium]|nr:amidohydrolase family protein [Tenuifilaceae bacterium]HPN21793.1 amidohydrolase family protein [Tenuifilaceae bacterium]